MFERMRNPKVPVEVSEVHVRAGEVVTVWLGELNDPGGRSQIELHVTKDGKRRVLLDEKSLVEVKSFDEVY
jgi:hypothetical protein